MTLVYTFFAVLALLLFLQARYSHDPRMELYARKGTYVMSAICAFCALLVLLASLLL